MTMPAQTSQYHILSRLLHWAMALLILVLLCVGFFMTGPDFSPQKLQIFMLHKSFGLLVLALVFLRLGWRVVVPPPGHLDSHARWERLLAALTHVVLYVLLIAMPLSGWLMSSAGDFPNSFFGLFEMPDLVAKDEAIFELMKDAHEIMAFAIIGLVGLHMAGALKHHLIDRDATLARMTWPRISLLSGFVIASLAGACLAGALALSLFEKIVAAETPGVPLQAQSQDAARSDEVSDDLEDRWSILTDRSAVEFTATQYGQSFSGRFGAVDGVIVFDPDDLAEGYVRVTIDVSGIATGSADRDSQASGPEWFDVAAYPQAVFEAREFEPQGAGQYIARGQLSIRDVTRPLDLPFTLEITDHEAGGDKTRQAAMKANLSLNRLDFGIGQGSWAATDVIGADVDLSIALQARSSEKN